MFTFSRRLGPPSREVPIQSHHEVRRCARCHSEPPRRDATIFTFKTPLVASDNRQSRKTRVPITKHLSFEVQTPRDSLTSSSHLQNISTLKLELRPTAPTPVAVSCLRHTPRPVVASPPSEPKLSSRSIPAMKSQMESVSMTIESRMKNPRAVSEKKVCLSAAEKFVAAVAEYNGSYRISEPKRKRKRIRFAKDHKLVTTHFYSPENSITGSVDKAMTPARKHIKSCWL